MSKPDDISQKAWDDAYEAIYLSPDLQGERVNVARAIDAAVAAERHNIWAIVSGNAVGERELERLAREANDEEGALIHAFLARENEQLAATILKRGEA